MFKYTIASNDTISSHIKSTIHCSFNIVLHYSRYEPKSVDVHVSFDAATEVNFTLTKSELLAWSKDADFGIKENVKKVYTNNTLIQEELRQLAVVNKEIMEYSIIGKTKEGWSVPMIHLSKDLKNHELNEPHVLLIGGLHGDDPVTIEMVMRLIRHILQGMEISLLIMFVLWLLMFMYSFHK